MVLRELAVENGNDADLDDAVEPALDILSCLFNVFHGVMSRSTAVGFGDLGAVAHDDFVFFVEEVGCFVVFGHDVDADCCVDDGDDAFDDVEPIWSDVAAVKVANNYHRHPAMPAVPSMYKIPKASNPPTAPERAEATI